MKQLISLALILCALASPASAYIDAPPTLGRLIRYDATSIAVVRVEKVSKEKQAILYKKVADLKGKYPGDAIKQHIARRLTDPIGPDENPRPHGAQSILTWAEPGKTALFFHDGNRKTSATCVGRAWYFGWDGQDGWWSINEFEERGLAWAYLGSVEKLRRHIADILAGKEVVVTAARHDFAGGGNRELWDNQTAYGNLARDPRVAVWRVRASLEITSYSGKPADYVVGLGTGDKEAVPDLIARLQREDPSARRQAAEDLGQVGPEANSAVGALRRALQDGNTAVQVSAAEALWQITRKAEAALPTLSRALKDPQVAGRRLAALVLWRMGPQARDAVGVLAEALEDKDDDVRFNAAETLWRIGSGAKAALAALANALHDPNAKVRMAAGGALGTFGADAEPAVGPLIQALKDRDVQTRHFAARALVRVGTPRARQAAAPVLRQLLHEAPGGQRVRTEIMVFLWKIGPEPESTYPNFKTGDTGDLFTATQLLRKADSQTRKNAVPVLVAALKSPATKPEDRAYWAQALGEMGPDAAAAVPALAEALKDKDDKVRKAAADALASIRKK